MARKIQATSKRVAELAGVSQTTVSFALNNVDGTNISAETKQRVLEAARTIGYVPDAAARSLARGRNANIGLVNTQPHEQVFIDEYIPNIITGLSQITRKQGYRILVELVEDSNHSNSYLDLIRGKEVAGIIIALNQPQEDDIRVLVASVSDGLPIVSLSHWHENLPSVMIDKPIGVEWLILHLIQMGHRRIACIPYTPCLSIST